MSKIPIYINVFNRLTTTRNLADQIAKIPDAEPIIVDNSSDWEPLLHWYKKDCPYTIIFVGENAGHRAPWRFIESHDKFTEKWGQSFYGITDCDLCLEGIPGDVLGVLREPFSWNEGVVKSGLSLKISDLPEWQIDVVGWELQWWKRPIRDRRFYRASIDTTFFLANSQTPHETAQSPGDVNSVRSAPPYMARHIPWYLDCENLDEENLHYFKTSNISASWRPLGKRVRSDANELLESGKLPAQAPQTSSRLFYGTRKPREKVTDKPRVQRNRRQHQSDLRN